MSGAEVVVATPIIYTGQGTASGTLRAAPFTGVSVTVLLTGDTASVITSPGRFDNVGPGSITILGIDTAIFTEQVGAYRDSNGPGGTARAGIANTVGSVLGTTNATFAPYDLTTAIGPIVGPSAFRTDLSYSTNLGTLHFTSVGSTSTFIAVLAPEPSSFAAMCMGMALIGHRFRKLRQ